MSAQSRQTKVWSQEGKTNAPKALILQPEHDIASKVAHGYSVHRIVNSINMIKFQNALLCLSGIQLQKAQYNVYLDNDDKTMSIEKCKYCI